MAIAKELKLIKYETEDGLRHVVVTSPAARAQETITLGVNTFYLKGELVLGPKDPEFNKVISDWQAGKI